MNDRSSQESRVGAGPKISIISAVFNAMPMAEEMITSVVGQSYANKEFIIIDGGSTDGTGDLIRKYADDIAYWVSEKDNSIYDAMNKGLSKATGEWLIFLGADDRFYDRDVLRDVFAGSDFVEDFLYGDIKYSNGKYFRSEYSWKLFFKNTLHHQGVFYNKNIFNDFKYDTVFRILADYDLNLKLYRQKSNGFRVRKIISFCGHEGISKNVDYRMYREEIRIKRNRFNFFLGIIAAGFVNLKYWSKKTLLFFKTKKGR